MITQQAKLGSGSRACGILQVSVPSFVFMFQQVHLSALLGSPVIAVCPHSYSLEGLTGVQEELRGPITQGPRILEPSMLPRHDSLDRGSLVSLTEEQEELVENSRMHDLVRKHRHTLIYRYRDEPEGNPQTILSQNHSSGKRFTYT